MVVIKDVGEIYISSDGVHWIIPNFYDFPQKFGTVIRSPHIRFTDREWHMQVYTNGSGWFAICVSDHNHDSTFRFLRLGITGKSERNFVKFRAENNGKGLYGRKIFPTNFLKSWNEFMLPGGNLHAYFDVENDTSVSSAHTQLIQLSSGDGKQYFNQFFLSF